MDSKEVSYRELRDAVRDAIEDRAVWFYLLLKELQDGQEIKEVDFAKNAIFQFGKLKGQMMEPAEGPDLWAKKLITKTGQMVFEQELKEANKDKAVLEFSYCPLVTGWKKVGASPKEISLLCKMARCGDFGRIAPFPLNLEFEKLIADGDDLCRLIVTKQNS